MWMIGLGLLGWSFAEYALHNWYGHRRKGRNEFSREHLAHHAKAHYFAPWWKKLHVSLIILPTMGVVTSCFIGWWYGLHFTVGFTVGYVGYEILHRRLHTHAPFGWYGRWARRHHFHHHFVDARVNHGVTSPLWDLVFRTYQAPAQIPVPERLAMDWLVDKEERDIRPSFQADYLLRRQRRRSEVASSSA